MNIQFYDLGALCQTQLDLRPLTVIIGPNNSNKTYIAYSVYGLLKKAGSTVSRRFINLLSIKEQHIVSIEINRFVESFLAEFEPNDFKEDLEGFFQDSSGQLFSNTTFEIRLSKDRLKQAIEQLIVQQQTSQFPLGEELQISRQSNVLFISTQETFVEVEDMKERAMVGLVIALNKQLFPSPFLLPAERNAFIISYKMLANKRFSLLKEREFFRSRDDTEKQLTILREQGDIRYPEPVEYFLDFLTDAELKPTGSTPKFQQLADKIETDILSKNQIFYKPTVLQGKEIKVKVNQRLTIDLYNASSSIKQITPLLLYLRYHAKPNDLLIIDEPEMNLHPESQAKLLEVFAILVNFGVNVLLTTHSPYFMDHLNSLVSGKINHPQVLQTQAKELYLKDARAFLTFDKVSAYEMKDNQLSSLKDEDDDIRWDTLSDVSHELQHKYFQIYEKGKVAR
jgi:predicted ATP-dependent endonuclease of OLD family